ncbi:MAG: hypothetical protein WDN28_12170 [Chthoniobacter sp.]
MPAEAVLKFLALVIVVELRIRAVGRDFEAVRGGAQADDRAAAVEVIDDGLHLLGLEILEAGEDDEEIGGP